MPTKLPSGLLRSAVAAAPPPSRSATARTRGSASQPRKRRLPAARTNRLGDDDRLKGGMSRPRTFPIVLAGFTAFLDLYATQPLLPLLMRVFGATHVAVSLTVTASTMAVALGAPVV